MEDSHLANEEFRHRTLYQKVMADLFRIEFSPAHWIAEAEEGEALLKDFYFHHLDECRRLAWQARTAHRISWKFTSLNWSQALENCSECSIWRIQHQEWIIVRGWKGAGLALVFQDISGTPSQSKRWIHRHSLNALNTRAFPTPGSDRGKQGVYPHPEFHSACR